MANRCVRSCIVQVRSRRSFGIQSHLFFMHSSRPVTEVEPQLTLRGHSAAITRLIVAPSKQLIYSASLDSTIRVWALPSSSHTTYAPFDASRLRGELIGHTDAVWDLALVRDECTLISGGAEGMVKVWEVSDPSGSGSQRLSWTYNGMDYDGEETDDQPGVTAVEAIKVDLKKVAVAYQNATIKIFDIAHGKELAVLHGESGSGKSYIYLKHYYSSNYWLRWGPFASKQHCFSSNHAPFNHCTRGQIYKHI